MMFLFDSSTKKKINNLISLNEDAESFKKYLDLIMLSRTSFNIDKTPKFGITIILLLHFPDDVIRVITC